MDGSRGFTRNESFNHSRLYSDSKTRREIYQIKPMLVDVSDTQSDKSTMPSVQQQFDTLIAIQEYNKGLKPARRAKDSLPEINTTGIATRDRFVKDYKKGKLNQERKYH